MDALPLIFIDHLVELLHDDELRELSGRLSNEKWNSTLLLHRNSRQNYEILIDHQPNGWKLQFQTAEGLVLKIKDVRSLERRFSRFTSLSVVHAMSAIPDFGLNEAVTKNEILETLKIFKISASRSPRLHIFQCSETYDFIYGNLGAVPSNDVRIQRSSDEACAFIDRQVGLHRLRKLYVLSIHSTSTFDCILRLVPQEHFQALTLYAHGEQMPLSIVEVCVRKWLQKANFSFTLIANLHGESELAKIKELFTTQESDGCYELWTDTPSSKLCRCAKYGRYGNAFVCSPIYVPRP